ncbi:MAG: hypothetical protein WBB01_25520 [Phormidesmis sp.]
MSNISWKSQLSGGLAFIALLCAGSPAQSKAPDLTLARQLAGIAFGYAQAQQPEKAIALLEQAETYVGEDCFEAIAWLKIGVAYQSAGDQDQGEQFLTRAAESAAERTAGDCYSSATSPTESFLNRAAEYAEAGHLDLALQLTTRVDSFFELLTLAKIATAYAEVGQLRKAEQILTQAIASHQALVAQLTQDNSDSVPASSVNNLLPLMAGQLFQSGQPELAKFVVEQSELVPAQLPDLAQASEDTESDISRYLFIASLLADLEQSQQALLLLDSIVLGIQPSAQYPMEAIYSWVAAAQIYDKLDSSRATQVLAQAQTSLTQLSSPMLPPSAQAEIVRGYAGIGDFDQALDLAKSIDDVSQRQIAHGAIAAAYAKAGLSAEADKLIESIGNPQFARIDMLRAYLETEQYAQAEQVAQQPDMREFLPEVGVAYCEAGLPEQTVLLVEQSPSKDWLRKCAATEFAKRGEFERASVLAQTIEEPETRAEALTQIAAQYTNPTADSRWHRLWRRLASPWQRWLGGSHSKSAAELLDQALSLIQPE